MGADTKSNDITMDIKVDTSGLEKAVSLMERLAAAAERACDAIVTFSSAAVTADDIVTLEVKADETPREILAELKALRKDLADQRVSEADEGANPLIDLFKP